MSLDEDFITKVDTTPTDCDPVELCCRVCLQLEDLMVHIYDDGVVEDLQSDLITLLERCGGIKVESCDNLPKFLCKECTGELLVAAKFREKCERSQLLLDVANLKEPTETNEQNILSENEHTNDLQLLELQAADDLIQVDLDETLSDGVILISAQEDCAEIIEEEHENVMCEETYVDDYCEEDQTLENGTTANFENPNEEVPNIKNTFESIIPADEAMQKKPTNEFTCDACGATFMHASNLQRHMKREHFLLQPYNCTNCGYTYSLEETYRKHCLNCKQTNNYSETTSTQQRKCKYCGKYLQSTFALNMHLRTHTGERPFKCIHCPKAFKTQSAHTMHMKRHVSKPDLICSICQKTFYERSNLTAHMRTHTGEKPHACSFCQKRFSRVFLLQLHLRTHTGEKPYQCNTCNRNFAQLCDLRNHERTHSGERRFKCSYCDKSFIKRCSLTAHLQRHIVPQTKDDDSSVAVNKAHEEAEQQTTEEHKEADIAMKYTTIEESILEADNYFLSKATEDGFCDLAYGEVTRLSETDQDIAWSNFVVEEI